MSSQISPNISVTAILIVFKYWGLFNMCSACKYSPSRHYTIIKTDLNWPGEAFCLLKKRKNHTDILWLSTLRLAAALPFPYIALEANSAWQGAWQALLSSSCSQHQDTGTTAAPGRTRPGRKPRASCGLVGPGAILQNWLSELMGSALLHQAAPAERAQVSPQRGARGGSALLWAHGAQKASWTEPWGSPHPATPPCHAQPRAVRKVFFFLHICNTGHRVCGRPSSITTQSLSASLNKPDLNHSLKTAFALETVFRKSLSHRSAPR